MQLEKKFFNPNDSVTEEDKNYFKQLVDPDNKISPFYGFIGNRKAISKLSIIAFDALQKDNHLCRDISLCITGPASSGKTSLVRSFSKLLQLPLIEISPRSITNLNDLAEQISISLYKENVPLTEQGENSYVLPPCIVFIDEVHALRNNIVQGLLKATETKDAVLTTEHGSRIDCYNACWIIATTDIGKVFDAFRSRFSGLELNYLTKKEIGQIVNYNFPELPRDVCDLVAHYNSKIPRKAIEFTKYMKLHRSMNNLSWADTAKTIASNEGIDEYGMHETHLSILKYVYKYKTVAMKRLQYLLNKKIEEIEKYILPWLLADSEDQPSLVYVTPRGLKLTKQGRKELLKRNIIEKKIKEVV
jgi:Holliday junction resolvasome RuvABC ATP-dependent DNA helicase subunit